MAEAHRQWREALGAQALGQLDPAERQVLETHLEGCGACRGEAHALARVVAALATADPTRVAEPPVPPPSLEPSILAGVATERREATRRRRRRLLASVAAATAAAAALAGAVWGVAASRDEPEDERRIAFVGAPPGVRASARIEPKLWGTQVYLEVGGLAAGQIHYVWLENPDGSRTPAGTFTALAGRSIHVVCAAGPTPAQARAIGVSTKDGTTVLRAPLV